MVKNYKILQVIDTLNIGGAEKVFLDMSNLLHENNQTITAFFLLNAGILKPNLNSNIPIIELQRYKKWSILKMYRCRKILKNFDIIHCHCRHVYRYIKMVDLIFLTKKILLFQDHYGSINIDQSVPYLFNSFLKPKFYIGVSNVLNTWALNFLKLKEENIFLLQNIIIKQKYTDQILKSIDFILVSNIKENKNQLFAINLATRLNKKLLLIGQVRNKEYNKLVQNKLTLDIEVNNDVSNVQLILNSAKIGLHTSKSETGPLVIIEYLAQGLPFLAYETGEVSQLLKPYFPEYFINNFDLNHWEDRINLLLNKKPNTQKMAQVFENLFGKKQYLDKLMSIYICVKN